MGGSPAQRVSTDAPVAKSTVVIIWNCDGSDWCRCAAKKSSWYVAPSTKPSCSTQHKSRGGREQVTCLQGQVCLRDQSYEQRSHHSSASRISPGMRAVAGKRIVVRDLQLGRISIEVGVPQGSG